MSEVQLRSQSQYLHEKTTEEEYEAAFATELMARNEDEILNCLFAQDITTHYSIIINMVDLLESNSDLCHILIQNPTVFVPILDQAIQVVQGYYLKTHSLRSHMSQKSNCHARVMSLPHCPELVRTIIPGSEDIGRLLSISGTVIRTGITKMLESERQYECGKCKKVFSVQSDVEQYNTVPKPLKCLAPSEGVLCNSTKFNAVSLQVGDMPESCQDYQEIKIQEQVNKLAIGSISFL
ncbi:DNA helicase mcm9 [Basidiobolus ranarum]|uniref:DNA helicase n=1 Tax=Basidiobolus ranarum TaxID=34480 RepID=A0ABR2W595_9FUNG